MVKWEGVAVQRARELARHDIGSEDIGFRVWVIGFGVKGLIPKPKTTRHCCLFR